MCDKQLLDFLLIKGNDSRRKVSAFLMYAGLIFAIIAAAGPSWQKEAAPSLNYNTPLMIALNLSSEMKQTDVTPNRLARAEMAMKDMLSLPQSADTGLIVYTDEPFLISPLSAAVLFLPSESAVSDTCAALSLLLISAGFAESKFSCFVLS